MLHKNFSKNIGVLLGVAAFWMSSTASAANILANPGFEDPAITGDEEYGGGTGWTSFGNAFRIQTLIGPAGAHGGTVVQKVWGLAGVYQEFAASEGQTWNGGAWVLNDSLDPMGGGQVAAVNIEWHGAGGLISYIDNGTFFCDGGDCSAAPQDQWVLKTITGIAPAGTTFARFVLITGGFRPGGPAGAPRYDDAFFEELSLVDTDGDDVLDNDDLCPDTASADPVDAAGCSDAQVDGDGDGICNDDALSDGPRPCVGVDACPGTVISEGVPTVRLGTNRWALVDDDFEFDTTVPKGKGPGRSYSTDDTDGCSCEQIIAALGLGKGHNKFGCSIGVMDGWVALPR